MDKSDNFLHNQNTINMQYLEMATKLSPLKGSIIMIDTQKK